MNRQSRLGSFLESCFNVGVGFVIALAAWEWMVRPMIIAGILSIEDSLWITIIFTIISVFRGFLVRRLSVWWSEFRRQRKRDIIPS